MDLNLINEKNAFNEVSCRVVRFKVNFLRQIQTHGRSATIRVKRKSHSAGLLAAECSVLISFDYFDMLSRLEPVSGLMHLRSLWSSEV